MTDEDALLARYQRALEAIAGSNNGPAGWIAHEALTGDPGHPRGLRMLDESAVARQRQDSLTDQMATIFQLAVDHGCYDAGDWIARRWHTRPFADNAEVVQRDRYRQALEHAEKLLLEARDIDEQDSDSTENMVYAVVSHALHGEGS